MLLYSLFDLLVCDPPPPSLTLPHQDRPLFIDMWLLKHKVAQGPLDGLTKETFKARDARLICTFSAVDSVLHENVYAQKVYGLLGGACLCLHACA